MLPSVFLMHVCVEGQLDLQDVVIQVDAMINGRRRDHGAERAHLEVIDPA